MRLIDADMLIQEWYRINDIDENDKGARFVGYTEIVRMINNMPTIEPKRGEWISREIKNNVYGGKYQLTCPFCDDSYIVSEQARPYERFCRYCGADMRGDTE